MVLIASLLSCSPVESSNEISRNALEVTVASTPVPNTEKLQVSRFCDELPKLKAMPYDPQEKNGDPVYEGLMEQNMLAVPCLVERITDTTPMHDPGPGPVFPDYRVGDAAVFMLLYVTNEEWDPETMLSREYAKRWKTEGIYAYFGFVEKSENRKKIQLWWKDWMKKNLK